MLGILRADEAILDAAFTALTARGQCAECGGCEVWRVLKNARTSIRDMPAPEALKGRHRTRLRIGRARL
jgi:hypothetical protein